MFSNGINQLNLTHFRSYTHLRIICDDRPVIITGPNGAGKTNILEAISFLNPGRGLRHAKLQDCLYNDRLNNSAKIWGVAAQVNHQNLLLKIGTSYTTNTNGIESKRIVQLQDTNCAQNELLNYLRLIWLTPQMDRIFIDGGSVRRKFLDRLVYLSDPLHATRIIKYELVVRERLKVLKSEWHTNTVWLDNIEQKIAELTVAIVDARQQTVLKLMQAENWTIGLFPKAELVLLGETETLLQDRSFLETEDKLRDLLRMRRREDRESARTSTGAHKSQFQVIYLAKHQLAEQCSTGEQKALLLSIVMAACRLQALRHESVPIILFDEVVAHLDAGRRQQLIKEILNLESQVWITGTDSMLFNDFGNNAQYFKIAENKIARYNCT